MELSVRRATQEDAQVAADFAASDASGCAELFASRSDRAAYVVETAFLSVAVVDADDNVLAIAAFSDAPPVGFDIPAAEFPTIFMNETANEEDIRPCDALWLTFALVDPAKVSAVGEMISQALPTVFATVPDCLAVLAGVPVKAEAGPVARAITDLPFECLGEFDICEFHGTLWTARRSSVVPRLLLREGVMEDYDDLMPLLLSGEGLVTPLPENLYLEELLASQDEHNAVIVAQAPAGEVVGVMCLRAAFEDQTALTKQYITDAFGKLRPTPQHPGPGGGTHPDHNMVEITFFFLKPEFDVSAAQFVPHLFRQFSFAEYAALYLPHAQPLHPMLHDFAYIHPRQVSNAALQGDRELPRGLYLCCRHTAAAVAVTHAEPQDEAQTAKLLQGQTELSRDAAHTMLAELFPMAGRASLSDMVMLLLRWDDTVVGAVIGRRCGVDELHSLRSSFALDSLIGFSPDGRKDHRAVNIALDPHEAPKTFYTDAMPALVVRHCYVRAAFRKRLRFLLREALRLSGTEVLLFPTSPQTDIFAPLVAEMVLTPPRPVNDMLDPTAAPPSQPPLWVLHSSSRRLLSDEKTVINARIVVVGGSTTGLAVLYSLLQIPYLHFNNLILVSQEGLPSHPQQRELQWSVDTMDWTEREYQALTVGRKIRTVEGTMLDFEKVDKYIFTNGSTCEPYDHLVLAVGRQYTIPKDLMRQSGARNGVFPLSNAAAALKVRQHIRESEVYEEERNRAVLYGGGLDVFAMATAVIQLGLSPQRIVIVSPAEASHSVFGDEAVDAAVSAQLEAMGVQLYRAHRLDRMECDEDNALRSVVVTPIAARGKSAVVQQSKQLEIDATMLLYAAEKDIDPQVLSALNKRSIVFDGRVIVEDSYRATDPHIYAAGPVAMFSRRFGPSHDFDSYSAAEVGRSLARTVLGFLGVDEFVDDRTGDSDERYVPKDDPLASQLGTQRQEAADELARRRPRPLPEYTEHVSRRVLLPGEQTYFTCESIEFQSLGAAACTLLSSRSADVDGGEAYLRIAVGPSGRIESVLYLGTDVSELGALQSLVGMPEATLNLVYEFNETQTEDGNPGGLDLLQYLRGHWARTAFNDRFRGWAAGAMEEWLQHPEVAAVRDELRTAIAAAGTAYVPEEARASALARLTADQDARHAMELALIKFMHGNKAFTPQRYFLPGVQYQ